MISKQNKYLYNGKELQEDDLGGVKLDWYSFGVREYDPQLGKWHAMDPAAELYYSWSPYNSVFNNPILIIDPDGACPTCNDDDYAYGATTSSDGTDWLYLGDGNWHDITGWSSGTIDGRTVYSPTNLWNDEGNVMTSEIAGNSDMFNYFANASWVSDDFRQDLMTSSIHNGQTEFANHSVTQMTISVLTFVATGGIEGLTSLTPIGIKGAKYLSKQGVKLLNYADDVAIKFEVLANSHTNIIKQRFIRNGIPKSVWNRISFSTKKSITTIYKTEYEFFSTTNVKRAIKAHGDINTIVESF